MIHCFSPFDELSPEGTETLGPTIGAKDTIESTFGCSDDFLVVLDCGAGDDDPTFPYADFVWC